MEQMLPRGFEVSDGKRIKRMIAEDNGWQIYLTNIDSYVLAVTPTLYEYWIKSYSLPRGLFQENLRPNCIVISSSGSYMISSMSQGPYPENNGQVEAFSIAFNTTTTLFKDVDICNAIYIEEYSLLLPTFPQNECVDKKVVYGKWLTGGISISIDSLSRVNQIMSWLPEESLLKSAHLAGFEIINNLETEAEETDATEGNSVEVTTQSGFISEAERFTLIGRPALEQFFNDNIIDIVLHQEQYKRMGIPFPGATILHGLPGCGKTYAVERLSEYLGWERFDIDSSTIASSYIHKTSKKISEVFQSAMKNAPSILVIDEMEAFLSNRSLSGHSGTYHIEEVAEFLRRIPEAISKGVLVFAMTNMIESIDPAILRRGRFDHIIEVKMPNAEEIEALLLAKFSELPVDESVDAKEIAKALDGHPMSDITFVLRESGRYAVKGNHDLINNNCFIEALNLPPKKEERQRIGF